MHHTDYGLFLILIAIFSITIGEEEPENAIKTIVQEYSKNGGRNIIASQNHVLKVSKNGILYEIADRLVCKGTYDGIPVAVKITPIEELFRHEIDIYKALNATNDENAEMNGIPKVYYHGNVFGSMFKAIAMSLFEGTVEQEYNRMEKPFSDFSILLIFKQAVKTLEYLNSKRVVHNDIKPGNLFLRGTQVFIADFDLSTLNGTHGNGFTMQYASANAFAKLRSKRLTKNQFKSLKLERFAMDDLESLIYSMWHVADFGSASPHGMEFLKRRGRDEVEPWVTEICEGFEFEIVKKIFKDTFIEEISSGRQVPQYDKIRRWLFGAIDEVNQITKRTKFEWLSRKRSVLKKILSIVKN